MWLISCTEAGVRVIVLRDYDVNKIIGGGFPSSFLRLLVDSLLFWPEIFVALLCLIGGRGRLIRG